MLTKKHTAWKKNRKLGDIYGGRTFPKLADKIFNRQHNLAAPTSSDETPIYILENPSRDFYFPVTIDEIKLTLTKLPKEHTEHLTHIWLQKIKKADYINGDTFQGCFICGSKVYLVVPQKVYNPIECCILRYSIGFLIAGYLQICKKACKFKDAFYAKTYSTIRFVS